MRSVRLSPRRYFQTPRAGRTWNPAHPPENSGAALSHSGLLRTSHREDWARGQRGSPQGPEGLGCSLGSSLCSREPLTPRELGAFGVGATLRARGGLPWAAAPPP